MATLTGRDSRTQNDTATFAVLTDQGRVRLVLAGSIDQLCVAELEEAVSETVRTGLPVEIDTRHVTFMDSAGIGALSSLTVASPHRVTFIEPAEVVRFLLHVTHLDATVEVVRRG
ncbi:STAS domain-containing protein [Georgenia sp. EYE_87]|uniref:STAS domain-containing protein n=1 Tax=Georgenia sp. EYE_87 TaxID=2853448 RepID=UPI002005D02C|nr:STAS domain-containing protein [Georgenia sp. EYE_87]MCK6210870.1 STAS domain-containing protein [Georgenia sp. EYE_87]